MVKINRINRANGPEQVTNIINKYINDFELSEIREKMNLGVDYYKSENTEIMNRKLYIYAEDNDGNPIKMEDPYKANNKLPSGYFKILVDQKINYLLGNPISLQANDDVEELGDTFQSKLKKVGKEASKKARGWLQVYINSEGDFDYKHIPSEQVIPVYNPTNNDKLDMAIRYYQVTELNDDDEAVKVNRVEVWDDEQVTYYQESAKDNLYYLLNKEEMYNIFGKYHSNPKYHFQKNLKYGEKVKKTEGLSWGQVPFIPLLNNDEEDYDLQPVKKFIDAYDLVNSDFINNLEDFQDVYWVLKGYNGENLNEFLQKVKAFKSLKVGENGDARAETIDIPYEARKEAKEGLEKDIFTFGQGVNPNDLQGGSITNIVIKSRFANLDLKADQFQDEVEKFIYRLIDFINRYRELKSKEAIELDKIVFDRAMIMNETEILEANSGQIKVVSEETRLNNHPWVNDAEKELKKMKNTDNLDLDKLE